MKRVWQLTVEDFMFSLWLCLIVSQSVSCDKRGRHFINTIGETAEATGKENVLDLNNRSRCFYSPIKVFCSTLEILLSLVTFCKKKKKN